MRLGDGAHDREAEPRASSRGAGRDETAKELRLDVLRDETSADHPHGGYAAFASHDDARGATGLTVDDGVVDEIVDRTCEPVRLSSDDDSLVDRKLDRRSPIDRRGSGGPREGAEIDLGRRLDPASFDSSE